MPLLRCREPLAPHCNVLAFGQERYKALYAQFLKPDMQALSQMRRFLVSQLQTASQLDNDLPDSPLALSSWAQEREQSISKRYNEYLQARKNGHARFYFPTKAHALEFLRKVAPTKLVDGAWLYSTLKNWQSHTLRPLVQTYLEELGKGDTTQNHVLLYQKLIELNGCSDISDLEDAYYHQGAIQLALGYVGEAFLPEVIGFNLGYEQLPLHLLICTYELEELGLDPHYFRLHITIDNGSTGHACQAIEAVLNNLPILGDAEQYYQRVKNGYLLNELGKSSTQIIEQLDLDQAVQDMLTRKKLHAQGLHSDRCKLAGKTINQWLEPEQNIANFLKALVEHGWIRRQEHAQNSRFWRLIEGPNAAMFGVFNRYELQLLHDWICDGCEDALWRTKKPLSVTATESLDNHPEAALVRQSLKGLDPSAKINRLTDLLAPATHYKPAGLYATQLFTALALGQ